MTIATILHSEPCSFTYLALSPQPSTKLTIIVPAFNEEAYLVATLDSIQAAAAQLRSRSNVDIDMIVVDNNSQNQTAAVARGRGARVVREPVQGIARARNAGARNADGEVLVFIDADVIVPHNLLQEVHAAMSDPDCVGGGVGPRLPAQTPFRQALPARMEGPGPPHRDGPGRNAVLPPERLRAGWRVRREGVDRRGRRLLLGPEEVRQENRSHGPLHDGVRACGPPAVASTSGLYGGP